ncbi:hypothetical protein RIF29_39088 [Crotalaria pallida]|uniref:Uncharacterized protein n=1 Tax=Crotalaria pallida TaxID=3830 RepID=A0AAN9E115_CROPI
MHGRSETVVSGAPNFKLLTGNDGNDGNGNLMDGNNEKDMIEENPPNSNQNILGSDPEGVDSPFGPWMLVHKLPKFKGKGILRDGIRKKGDNENISPNILSGSRFIALNNEQDSSIDGAMDNQVARGPFKKDLNADSNVTYSSNGRGKDVILQTQRISNPAAGKNSQLKPLQPKGLGAKAQPKSKSNATASTKGILVHPSSLVQPSPSFPKSDDNASVSMKERERVILLQMKDMESRGVNSLDQVSTRIYFSSPPHLLNHSLSTGSPSHEGPSPVPPDNPEPPLLGFVGHGMEIESDLAASNEVPNNSLALPDSSVEAGPDMVQSMVA